MVMDMLTTFPKSWKKVFEKTMPALLSGELISSFVIKFFSKVETDISKSIAY